MLVLCSRMSDLQSHPITRQTIPTTMRNTARVLTLIAGFVIATSRAVAASANRCVADGTLLNQQGSCPADELRKLPSVQELNAEAKRRRIAEASARDEAALAARKAPSGFSCDGRQYCSQMKSCAEAMYFLAHCPGVKMDGDRNGIPCEKQWCGR